MVFLKSTQYTFLTINFAPKDNYHIKMNIGNSSDALREYFDAGFGKNDHFIFVNSEDLGRTAHA